MSKIPAAGLPGLPSVSAIALPEIQNTSRVNQT
jgi:hypothetical protein